MHADVVDLREFYQSPLGRTVERLLRARLSLIWPQIRGEDVLALGYGVPLMPPLLEAGAVPFALMPAAQGVAYWPREGANLAALVDAQNLPIADNAVDRIVLMHALEGAADPQAVLYELWRVLKPSGRLLMILPNRRGLWAHSDRTPFGTGRPFSAFQIRDALRDHGFLVEQVGRALHFPPTSNRFVLRMADTLEKYGELLCPGFGGLLLIEASKQLYAPTTKKAFAPHLVLPLPLTPNAVAT
jgi:SAM-dependent methyltransferase